MAEIIKGKVTVSSIYNESVSKKPILFFTQYKLCRRLEICYILAEEEKTEIFLPSNA